jgi:DNA-directed RNA polymerase specialized sigma24 family protein
MARDFVGRNGQKFAQLRSAGIPVDETVAGREVVEALKRLIPALPRRLRDDVTLSTIEEMLPADVAAVLEISEAAMRSRLFRARQILRKKLRSPGHEGKKVAPVFQ